MTRFWTLKRLRAFIGLSRQFERRDDFGDFAFYLDPGGEPASHTSLQVSLLGFRAEAGGQTGFAALKLLRREHPVVVHVLYTYMAVLAILVALFIASAIPR
ncbi:hypothetical protein ABT274_12230 [Streptomyces sp. NPDC001127]|uniref:hypothetical protein n=1 Tax=Streptomyces sp. NPDC001127 TaxID=3154377 RepID=UPI00331A06A3